MARNPLVTIGLQTFNCASTVNAAVNSIISQSFQDWEMLVHDDGSTDGIERIARRWKDPRVCFIPDSINRRRAYRLNQSICRARGKYYAVMDGDDISFPDRLEAQLGFLESNPEVDVVGGQVAVFTDTQQILGCRVFPCDHASIVSAPWNGIRLAHPTVTGKTSWFRRWMYDINFLRVEDQDLFLRSFGESVFSNLGQIVLAYRESGLSCRRLARERYWFIRALKRNAPGRVSPAAFVRGLVTGSGKLAVDCAAISTGLKYKLLGHRARKISDKDRQRAAAVIFRCSDIP